MNVLEAMIAQVCGYYNLTFIEAIKDGYVIVSYQSEKNKSLDFGKLSLPLLKDYIQTKEGTIDYLELLYELQYLSPGLFKKKRNTTVPTGEKAVVLIPINKPK